ncbi:MAG TPA: glycosyltransferase [Bryobacteraceae bacterium]|nr:glycosyltransferase [Bryobacteraceae bacterium]
MSRFRDHVQIAGKFAAAAAECDAPDVVIAALPAIELCKACVDYGLARGVPVLLDMRDMWPDIFLDAVPRPVRPFARLLLSPLYRQAQRACAHATAIIGITEEFVDWGLRRGGRQRARLDKAFPIAYEVIAPPSEKLVAAEKFWDDRGIFKGQPGLTLCFFGSIGVQLDLKHVVDAARILNRRECNVRFVVCGQGERLEHYRRRARGLPNIFFPGWVDAAQIWTLMQRSSAGLDPLPDRYDFLATINNKAVEYLSAGLPVISSPLSGVLSDLLRKECCGLSYRAGSADELAGILEYLAADPAALPKMSVRARAIFDRDFWANAVHTRMAEHLAEVTAITSAPATVGQFS